jgi:LysM repeat protein
MARRTKVSMLMIVILMLAAACRDSEPDRQGDGVDHPAVTATSQQTIVSSGTVALREVDDLMQEETPSTSISAPSTPDSDRCPAAHSEWPLYPVAAGDTMQSIASRTGSSVEQLVEENCLENPEAIHIGLTLRVPIVPIAQSPTLTAVPTISSTLFLTPTIEYDTHGGYLLEAGQTVEVRWMAAPDLPANNQLEIAYHPAEMPAESIAILQNVSGIVAVQWEVPSFSNGTIVASLHIDQEGQDYRDEQVIQVRSQDVPECLFAPYGIGGDVPVFEDTDTNSAVIGYTSMGEQYPVVGAGGAWHVEGAGMSGQYYQILLDDLTLGWVQDMRGAIEGECSSF